jgi:serine/threonine protein phosphatase 1
MLADASSLSPHPARDSNVAVLGLPQRVWAVGPIYGRYGALCQVHEAIAKQITPGDRIVYLGNYLGATSQWSGEGKAVISELMAFRDAITPIPGFKPEDVVFLRGRLEDLCRQILRLPFQKDASLWAADAIEKGFGAYLAAYDVNPQALLDAASAGRFVTNRFTYYWQKIVSGYGGHQEFYDRLFDAARTDNLKPLAFIPEGLDARLPLGAQRETLFWPKEDAAGLTRYFNYARVVRGSGPQAQLDERHFVLTLEGGNRLDGALHALCVNSQNHVIESLTF